MNNNDELLRLQLLEIIRSQQLAIANFTQQQFVEALTQAVKSGDFVRYVMMDLSSSHRQAVAYIPFYDKQRLQSKVDSLTRRLSEAEVIVDSIASMSAGERVDHELFMKAFRYRLSES